MYTFICSAIFTAACLIYIQCFSVNTLVEEFTPKRILQVDQKLIECELGDVLFVTIPEWRHKGGKYYLYKPNGDQIKLKFEKAYTAAANHAQSTKQRDKKKYIKINLTKKELARENEDLEVVILNVKENNTEVLINEFIDHGSNDIGYEFIIGPLTELDHGNWVLSQYYEENGEVLDEYQVIVINISENIPLVPKTITLSESETWALSFAHPIQHVESCQLIAPPTTYDRYFEVDSEKRRFCGYKVPNVTREDTGTWNIIAVGMIVYVTEVNLTVVETD